MIFTTLIALGSACFGAAFTWLFLRGKEAARLERLRATLEENARILSEVTTLRAEIGRLQTVEAQLATKLDAARTAHDHAVNEFRALSAEALQRNNESFLKLAQATLEKFQEGAKGDLTARQLAVESLVKPLKESLEKMEAQNRAIENKREAAYGSLTEQLKGVATTNSALQSETTKLSRSLRSTSTAGRWGEIQLQRVVELAGMLENVDFIQQEGTSAGRPDMMIKLPGGKTIAVDAKAPMQAYLEAHEATDDTVRKAKFAEHARAVRGHIDALGNKAYWKGIQPSPEFVVLFIPGEAFYSAALRHEPDLFERGSNVGVILASPATLIALLKAAAYGWNQEALSKSTDDIRRLGLELYERITAFAKNLQELGQRLGQAVGAFNSTVYQAENQILVTARHFEKLRLGSEKKVVQVEPLSEIPKPITAPEFNR